MLAVSRVAMAGQQAPPHCPCHSRLNRHARQHGFYAESLRAHLCSLATGHGVGTISRSSSIARFIQGGVVKTFRCRDEAMRKFSLFALLWCVTTLSIATAVNVKSRVSYVVAVPDTPEITVYRRGFPIVYHTSIPEYQQLLWILINSAFVAVSSYLLFRGLRWLNNRHHPTTCLKVD